MKKAFDQNVSRARPRLRLGAMLNEAANTETPLQVEAMAEAISNEPAPVIPDLAHMVRAKAEAAKEPKPTAVEQLRSALAEAHAAETRVAVVEAPAPVAAAPVFEPAPAPVAVAAPQRFEPAPAAVAAPQRFESAPVAVAAAAHLEPAAKPVVAAAPVHTRFESARPPPAPVAEKVEAKVFQPESKTRTYEVKPLRSEAAVKTKVRASAEAPPQVVEVQSPRPPSPEPEGVADLRRERLKERLKAVRENPRPEPLPETVAEAGVLAVERISALQTEVVKVRSVNLALSQDLEASRRQSERATEEARLRMDEARRLAGEMDARAKLLADLERELAALEGERNESLLALQEARAALDSGENDKEALRMEIIKRDQALADSLSEEERLASELESAHESSSLLRRSVDSLRQERDTLARQVSDLTRERAELLEARKALEAVHRALSQAAAR